MQEALDRHLDGFDRAVANGLERTVGYATSRLTRKSRIRYSWDRAVEHCDLKPIRVKRIERIGAGWRLHVRLPHGLDFPTVAARSERLAASMRVGSVKIHRDLSDAGRATITLVSQDPLLEPVGEWPVGDAVSLWDRIPVGINEHGGPVRIALPERNLLLGGAPGAGKSAAMSMILATAALDPSVQIHLIDGKEVEFAPWEACAESFASKMPDAIRTLQRIRQLMDERYSQLKRAGLRKVEPGTGWPLILLAVDELALFTAGGEKKDRDEFSDSIRDLVARGRAAGVIAICATQKPSTDVVPSSLRDLFAYKWALHCATPQASDTILGQGWASQGYDAAKIGRGHPGVGFLLAEDGLPIRCRTFYLEDKDIRALAERARNGRRR